MNTSEREELRKALVEWEEACTCPKCGAYKSFMNTVRCSVVTSICFNCGYKVRTSLEAGKL